MRSANSGVISSECGRANQELHPISREVQLPEGEKSVKTNQIIKSWGIWEGISGGQQTSDTSVDFSPTIEKTDRVSLGLRSADGCRIER